MQMDTCNAVIIDMYKANRISNQIRGSRRKSSLSQYSDEGKTTEQRSMSMSMSMIPSHAEHLTYAIAMTNAHPL